MLFHKHLCTLLFLFIACSAIAQQKPEYSKDWDKVEGFINKGLTKSALDEVEIIYSLAKKDNNEPQIIKALISKITLNQNITENAAPKNIDTIQLEIAKSSGTAKAVLQSIAAEMYWNYFQQQRYKLYNRTKTTDFKKEDINTWGIDDFHRRIAELYISSIDNEKLLKETKLEPFDAIIIKGNARHLRPTLYDLLAHRALDYFKSDEQDVNKPAYAFEIKDEKVFAPGPIFINHTFINKDSASLHYRALVIFQNLIAFHLTDVNHEALIDVDIERVLFAKQYGVMNDKDELYIQALDHIVKMFHEPATAQASYLVAQMIYDKAAQKTDSDSGSYSIVKAKNIVDLVINKYPGSEGGINARNLLNQILHKTISLTSEKVNLPGEPFRSLVAYKNISSVYLRIIAMTPEFKKSLENPSSDDTRWNLLIAQKPLRNWQQKLPLPEDYRDHSVEIKIDALPVGQYAILASGSENFNLNKNPLSVQYFHVSGISYINSGLDYFILDRKSGLPLDGAKVQVWSQHYDYSSRLNTLERKELLTADKNGYVKVTESKKNENNNYRLEITYHSDKLFLDDYQYSYNNSSEGNKYDNQATYDSEKAKIFLFTDRSIYRPGQLVYFKGIGITQDYRTKRNQLLSYKDSMTFILYDSNDQQVDSLKLQLNEFGSLHGTFRLPLNKLNGNFRIEADDFNNSKIEFSVEEYKRPNFYAEFEKVKGTYHVNDQVKITGFAKGYAGNNVDGAKVKYRVTRVARFLYDWMFWWRPRPRTQPLEIAHGDTTTGTDGNFTIAFNAIPDLNIDKSTEPVFDYKVEADITDINGETRSTTITVPVGYKALDLQLTLPSTGPIPVDSFRYLFVSSKNLSGQFEPSKVRLTIYHLQTPARLIRSRYWPQPDQFIMDKKEFLQYFPNDEYKDELKKETWEKDKLVYSTTDSTTVNSKFPIVSSAFSQGWYVAEAISRDKYGQEVKNVKYFELYDMKKPSLALPSYTWNTVIKNEVEPGEKASFIAGTSANNVFLIQQVDKAVTSNAEAGDDNTTSPEQKKFTFFPLDNAKKNFEYPVREDSRGGFSVFQFFVKDNRFFSTSWNISIPWTNKELAISFDTYRDKTLPGSEEKWKVKISGSKGEKVAAEMLASMYDASLDQFKPHTWETLNIWPTHYGYNSWQGNQNFSSVNSNERWWRENYVQYREKIYDHLITLYDQGPRHMKMPMGMAEAAKSMSGAAQQLRHDDNVVVTGLGQKRETKELGYSTSTIAVRGLGSITGSLSPLIVVDGVIFKGNLNDLNPNDINNISVLKDAAAVTLYGTAAANGVVIITTKSGGKAKEDLSNVQTRKNFNETAFFYPDLHTDKEGNIEFSFTMPEALTQWKMMAFAHTKDLSSGYAQRTVVTQKDLMIQPFVPRFLREGDKMEFTAKIVNLGSIEINGQAQLQLLNASTMLPVDGWFKNTNPQQPFTIAAGQSTLVSFSIEIPSNFNNAVVYRIVAKAGDVSDGEEAAIPVLTNRMLVTETMPLPVRGSTTKTFTFEKLLNSKQSSTLTNYSLTTEYTTNPAWYAVQALPYLMEFPYECAEQTFNRYYANSIATKIINSAPAIKAVFAKWKITDTSALISNLQKNEELKSVLLQETPWVLQAQNETQQKKNVAMLFDMLRMNNELESALSKLLDMQTSNGGFCWFKGGRDDRYITQYIVTGIGHLKKLGAFYQLHQQKLKSILSAALPYLDMRFKEDYDNLLKYKINLDQNNIGYISIQYLYMRSFFPEYPIAKESETAYNYYRNNAKKYWLANSKYSQAMIALALYRTDDNVTAAAIVKSLQQNSINSEELGMYWKEWNTGGYYWYQAPIESQAMMIEAFSEIGKDIKIVDDLKTWLLKNKQTNNWHTTKATAEACYALLLQGTDWLAEDKNVTIKLGSTIVNSKDENQEAGTGYFKKQIDGSRVTPDMGNISVTVSPVSKGNGNPSLQSNSSGASWGAVYWQYFENLDKITFSETPLKLNKKLFIEKNTDRGPVLNPIEEGAVVKVGDKIKVRIELRVDREMEYVHMKDMRASCMEPVNVLSEYKYQGGLGYYETTKDASTNFFFSWLPKGTYVFEYPMFVTHSGNFSNGITSIQCMYAPEFTAHSEGVRVNVGK